jgi:mono/diheme cytochrome c family protein
MSRKTLIAVFALLAVGAFAALYRFALPGLSSARPSPPAIEVEVATWLLLHSVPPEAAARANPLQPDEANIAAGASSFQQRCAVCHGFDGSGRTTIGEHVYPRAPSLRQALPTLTDGQIFTYINDGIRNTAMPAWDLPENEIWQIVAFLRHLQPLPAPPLARRRLTPSRPIMSVRPPANPVTRKSMTAGGRREWPMSCVIRASTRTPSSPTCRSLIPC